MVPYRSARQSLRLSHHPAVVYAVADRLSQQDGSQIPFAKRGLRRIAFS